MPSIRDTSIMLKLIMVLLYMMTEWLLWMKPMPAQRQKVLHTRTPAHPGKERRLSASTIHVIKRVHSKPTVVQSSDVQLTTHISCKVEDVVASLDNLLAILIDPQIHQMKLITEHLLLQEPRKLRLKLR